MRAQLVDRLVELSRRATPAMVGIVAPPGAGKSTLAGELRAGLIAHGFTPREVAVAPMDGFHLADVTLTELEAIGRKGALDTFDGDGFLAALRRIRAGSPRSIYLPGFERELEQPIAAALTVSPEVRVVLVEGNYLLVDEEPWRNVAELLDETWFLELDDALRRRRLIARHEEFGKSPADARRWVDEVDEPNAAFVSATRHRSDLVIPL